MNKKLKPHIVDFPKIGNSSLGYISLAERTTLPFDVKRVYWTYFTPEDVERGNHAHYELEQILVAVTGKIVLNIITIDGQEYEFVLDRPDRGVYIPKLCWRTMKYSHNSVQMCLASSEYSEADYIRSLEDFKKMIEI